MTTPHAPSFRFAALRPHLIALALYTVLTLVFTFPLVLHLNTHVLAVRDNATGEGRRMDNMEYVWKTGWVAHALTDDDPVSTPLFAPAIYYPFGYPLAYGEITPIHTFGLLPLTLTLGATITYNLAAIGSTILTGWATYALARRFLRKSGIERGWLHHGVAFFAGAAFAFCGYRMQKLTGHLPLFDTHWLALALLQFDLWLERRRRTDAALFGLWLGLAGLSSWYYVYLLGLTLPFYALFVRPTWKLWRDPFWRERRTWLGIASMGIIAATLIIPFLIPYVQLNTAGDTRVPLDDASFWAASPTDYLMPNPLHPLWGAAIQRAMWPLPGEMPTEFVIQIGWAVLAFALVGWRRARGESWRGLKALLLVAFVLSLGPVLHLSRLPLGIPLPAALLREGFPFADSIRTWGRFAVLVMLAASLFGAVGLAFVVRALKPYTQRLVFGGVLAFLLFESWIGLFPLADVAPRPVDTWLADQPGDAPMMEYPLSVALSGPAILSTHYHGRPVTFGYGTYLPLLYRERHPALLTFPDDPALDQLAAWGVQEILVTTEALPTEPYTLADIDAQPRLRRVAELGGVIVYRLDG